MKTTGTLLHKLVKGSKNKGQGCLYEDNVKLSSRRNSPRCEVGIEDANIKLVQKFKYLENVLPGVR